MAGLGEREQFLLAAFVIWRYGRMAPRSHNSPAVKPSSVRPYVDTVRNVHLRRGITLAPAPVVSRVLKGMLKNYVRVHGTDALIPTRKEPIENRHCAAIYAIGRSAPARVGRHTVSWRTPRFRCFKALLNGLRQTGGRKADMLPVTPAEFDRSCVTRSHARWLIHGVIVDDPTAEQLRSLREQIRLLEVANQDVVEMERRIESQIGVREWEDVRAKVVAGGESGSHQSTHSKQTGHTNITYRSRFEKL